MPSAAAYDAPATVQKLDLLRLRNSTLQGNYIRLSVNLKLKTWRFFRLKLVTSQFFGVNHQDSQLLPEVDIMQNTNFPRIIEKILKLLSKFGD